MEQKNIAVLTGDGISNEVMNETLRVLDFIKPHLNFSIKTTKALIGGEAFDFYNEHCPKETIKVCNDACAILFGSVGGPVNAQNERKWKNCEANSILALRKEFNFGVNIRPIPMFKALKDISPLKNEILEKGANIIIFRELLGGIYFGEHLQGETRKGVKFAIDKSQYDEEQIEYIVNEAFKKAQKRRKILTSVDKANVLATSKLWRKVVDKISKKYPDVKLNHMYIDNCAMQLILNPSQFDVVLTSNLFGDILSDLASVLPGSIGVVPSASLNEKGKGLYEPSGGSAYDIKGLGIANPIAQILSLALLFEHSFNLSSISQKIFNAIEKTLNQGFRTKDLDKNNYLSTKDFTSKIIENLNL